MKKTLRWLCLLLCCLLLAPPGLSVLPVPSAPQVPPALPVKG